MTQNEKMSTLNNESADVATTYRTVVPAVDIREFPGSYVVRLDIPGASKESIKAQVTDNTLTVTAKADACFKQDATLLYDDSMPTEYLREFTLADNIDRQSIDAAYDLGVLSVTIKKKEQYLPKEISIK